MVYGPTLLFALGEGAVLPMLPVIASNVGADLATASLVAAALVVGQLGGNLPAGWLVSRIGERLTMALAGVLVLFACALGLWAPNVQVLMATMLLIGLAAAAFALARHSFMTTRVPLPLRARSLSLLGGTFRFGMFLGPFTAAALVGLSGDERTTLWFLAACTVALILLVILGPDPEKSIPRIEPARGQRGIDETVGQPLAAEAEARGANLGVMRTMWLNRGVLARLGVAAASLSAVRQTRQLVLPLWGVSIGLPAESIALVVGISGAIDFALFYASGQVMDRFGRLWAALPAMLLMGSGFIALSLTHDREDASMWFAAFAMVLGVGNGLSSGILLTLGADLAPPDNPAPFLGSWRTLTDAGGATAPLLVSGVTALGSLAVATGLVGAIGLLGALGFLRWVPRFAPRPPRDRPHPDEDIPTAGD